MNKDIHRIDILILGSEESIISFGEQELEEASHSYSTGIIIPTEELLTTLFKRRNSHDKLL